jgi:hypothetical protein
MTLKDPFIFRVLDISTGHMTKEDNERLQYLESNCKAYSGYELRDYGWLLYVGEIEENWSEDDKWSSAFMNIMKTAQKAGCEYVRFDRDGRDYDELPKFDW